MDARTDTQEATVTGHPVLPVLEPRYPAIRVERATSVNRAGEQPTPVGRAS
jgi:hypothetical protein